MLLKDALFPLGIKGTLRLGDEQRRVYLWVLLRTLGSVAMQPVLIWTPREKSIPARSAHLDTSTSYLADVLSALWQGKDPQGRAGFLFNSLYMYAHKSFPSLQFDPPDREFLSIFDREEDISSVASVLRL
jgi:hypothetical protein